MGSLLIGRSLIKTLQLSAGVEEGAVPGVEYHLDNAANTPRRVKQLKNAIDAGGLTDLQEQELTLGAVAFMALLNDLYNQLPVSVAASAATVAKCPMHVALNTSRLMSA